MTHEDEQEAVEDWSADREATAAHMAERLDGAGVDHRCDCGREVDREWQQCPRCYQERIDELEAL
jgi:hypothetical protein